MTIALIDNGSLEPAAHRNLRAVAAALSERVGVYVHAVSWKHSDRIGPAELDGARAWTVARFIAAQIDAGEREFVFVPFFISAQGAIGSALRRDLEKLQAERGGFDFTFTSGLADQGALVSIVVDRIRTCIRAARLKTPPVIVVDHGGPSSASAEVRDAVAAEAWAELGAEVGPFAAASMEGEDYAHNRPLFADQLASPGFDRGDVVIAPLFLSPGRHAGPDGDLATLARAAAADGRHHFTELVGTHPRVVEALAAAVRETLAATPASVQTSSAFA